MVVPTESELLPEMSECEVLLAEGEAPRPMPAATSALKRLLLPLVLGVFAVIAAGVVWGVGWPGRSTTETQRSAVRGDIGLSIARLTSAKKVAFKGGGCSDDTGGTCKWWGCNSWRHATCTSGRCKCPHGTCAFGGRCADKPPIQCSKDTGGTCNILGCDDWRSASCISGQCLCKPDECAIEGRCVKPMNTPEKVPKKVAVVGCGIAGALTALELAHRGVNVTVIDREGDCGVGTSGRIAAEMMFYSYNKAIWKGGWADVEGMIHALFNLQGSASPAGMSNAARWYKKRGCYNGKSVKVELQHYSKGQLRFRRGAVAPVVSASSLRDVAEGFILEDISKLPPQDVFMMNQAVDADKKLQDYLAQAPKPVTLTFVKGADARTNKVYEAAFFSAAGDRLRDFFLVQFPELCEAVVTPLCCVSGTVARKWVDANPEKAGYTCPSDPFAPTTENDAGMGVAHVLVSGDKMQNIQGHHQKDRFDFEVWDATQTKKRLNNWVEGMTVEGTVVNRLESGFVRTELVFGVVKKLLQRYGATFQFDREITHIEPLSEGVRLKMRVPGGSWSIQGNIKTFTPALFPGSDIFVNQYDRVVFATGAAVGQGLLQFDPSLRDQILPVDGYIVLGKEGQFPKKDRRIGVVFEMSHMYLRTTRKGNAAVGGGMMIKSGSDSEVRALRWMDGFDGFSFFNANDYMSQEPLGKKLVEDPQTLKMGGVRPLSVFGNFPLLKSYYGGRVVLNTGGGANGFVTSWKSGQIAVDLALAGHPSEVLWNESFTAV